MSRARFIVGPALAILIAAAGCSKKPPDCATAAQAAGRAVQDSLRHQPAFAQRDHTVQEVARTTADGFVQVYRDRCTADGWSDDMRTCLSAADTTEATEACKHENLTPDQRAALDHAIEATRHQIDGAFH